MRDGSSEKSKWNVRGYLNVREYRQGMDTSTSDIFEAYDIEEAIRLAKSAGYDHIDFVRKLS